jgi:hypothetical protein
MKLAENIKTKLAEAVELWANENLCGKPALLANCIYMSVEKTFIEQIKKIQENFKETK